MQKENGFAKVNGTNLYYEMAGSGNTIVLIHGFSDCTREWDEQFEPFAQHHRVIRYDVRGFGNSARPSTQRYSHSDDLKALLDYLGATRAHILGASMGGGIAIDFAIAYPKMTSSLIPADSALWGFKWSDEWKKRWKETYNVLGSFYREGRLQDAMAFWMNDPMIKPAMRKPGFAFRLVQIAAGYSGWHYLNEDPVLDLDPLAAERLKEIKLPTLVIVGGLDLPDFHAIADKLQKDISNARKVVIPGVGHCSSLEDPDRFNDAVLSFIREVEEQEPSKNV